MSKPDYVVSRIEGRARLRHRVFSTKEGVKAARDVFSGHKEITRVEQGPQSFLLFFDPCFPLETVCQELEEALPALTAKKEMLCDSLEKCLGISPRKAEVRLLCVMMGFAALLGFVDGGKAHGWAALAASLLAIRHIWIRRHAL